MKDISTYPHDCLMKTLDRVGGTALAELSNVDRILLHEALRDLPEDEGALECQVPDCTVRASIVSLAGKITVIEIDIISDQQPCRTDDES